jgi:hypothetical protein
MAHEVNEGFKIFKYSDLRKEAVIAFVALFVLSHLLPSWALTGLQCPKLSDLLQQTSRAACVDVF